MFCVHLVVQESVHTINIKGAKKATLGYNAIKKSRFPTNLSLTISKIPQPSIDSLKVSKEPLCNIKILWLLMALCGTNPTKNVSALFNYIKNTHVIN